MKRYKKHCPVPGQFIDFLIITALLISLFSGIFFSKAILYGKSQIGRTITIETELMPDIHEGKLCEGDTVYDTLTKRRLGEVRNLTAERENDKLYYRFTLDSSAEPRGKALRTEKLWFYFKEIASEDKDTVL